MDGFDGALHVFPRRIRQRNEVGQVAREPLPQTIPFLRIGGRCSGREALCSMFWIQRLLTANTAQFVVHPVIHVEDELSDGVGKAFYVPARQVGGKIFGAGYGIGVGAFAVEQFSECA